MGKGKDQYSDFANVEAQRNFLTPEQLPEGPYGAPRNKYEPVNNEKSAPWTEKQRYYSAFNYENKALHQDLPRQEDGAHPLHDETDEDLKPSEEKH
ncbi:cytosolic protein [Halobacillus litoralis]|uniref:Cytosolic protein n=1 Tax=Halobacillus litoralis TaxID=45668 RepID=A0A410MGM4_9BACI|nr:cytosolic protein [Halobacillus litoralis]QAS53838.1 cytosolic protein [Halobacillus litoralis]